jgi:Protein of unknown function (DUF5672)
VNIEATVAAIEATMDQIVFADVLLFTDKSVESLPPGARIMPIAPLGCGADYSTFLLRQLAGHVRTDHCLVIQWDGFVIDPKQWDLAFLAYDYIGAPWPQFHDGHDVGNGGFSLRSRRLLEACSSAQFVASHPEDVAICRTNRDLLEREFGIRIADRECAARFAFERSQQNCASFGFHGVFNMIPLLGEERFWSLYRTLDDRRTVHTDLGLLIRQIGNGPHQFSRRSRLLLDRVKDLFPTIQP